MSAVAVTRDVFAQQDIGTDQLVKDVFESRGA
jgi:hypothetical protein